MSDVVFPVSVLTRGHPNSAVLCPRSAPIPTQETSPASTHTRRTARSWTSPGAPSSQVSVLASTTTRGRPFGSADTPLSRSAAPGNLDDVLPQFKALRVLRVRSRDDGDGVKYDKVNPMQIRGSALPMSRALLCAGTYRTHSPLAAKTLTHGAQVPSRWWHACQRLFANCPFRIALK